MATNCNTFCISNLCRDRKACACQCEAWFGGTNPVLVEPCQAACYVDPSIGVGTKEDYLCGEIGAQEMYNNLGYVCSDFDPLTGTAQGQAFTEQQEVIDKQKLTTRNTIIFAFVLMVILLIVYLYIK